MSVLATAIYAILRSLVPAPAAEITYEDLVEQLGPMPPPNQDLRPRDPRLDIALGEIVTTCRNHKPPLPALPAIVVRKYERTPGEGYYRIAHPDVPQDWAHWMIAWGNEVIRVRQTTYPAAL